MRHTKEEVLSELLRRSDVIMQNRSRRTDRALSGTAGALIVALLLVIVLLPGKTAVSQAGSVYGAFLLSKEAGGYVLAAVIAFALGIAVTLLCLRRRKNKQSGENHIIHTEDAS